MDVAFSSILQWIILFITTCVILLFGFFYHKYSYWKTRGVPYEKPFLFFGNLSFAMRKSVWDFCLEVKRKHPRDYVGIFLAWQPTLLVQTPELARRILVKDHEYFQDRFLYSRKSDPLGSLNLFTLKNPKWSEMRHEISPMFTANRLKNYTKLMNMNAVELVRKIQRDYVDAKKTVDLKIQKSLDETVAPASLFLGFSISWRLMRRQLTYDHILGDHLQERKAPLTDFRLNLCFYGHTSVTMTTYQQELFSMYASDTVAYTAFGIRVSVLNDQPSPLWYITSHMVKWTFWRGFEFTMIFLIPAVAAILKFCFFSPKATEYIKKIFWDVVNDRNKVGKSSDKDLVNHLLKLKENLKLPADTGSELADNLMLAQAAVFILGAIATSATTLSYALHELAYNSEAQEKLFNEVSKAMVQSGKDVLEYEELVELKYLSACINETLRKYPPVAYLDRQCSKKYKLNDELIIEKGVPVFVNVLAIHYDENIYPEPEKWRPERMNVSSDNDNLNFTFLPFGEGPRFCIGKRYGLMQVRAALAQIILKYQLKPAVPYNIKTDPYSVMLSPDKCSVKFVER